MTHRVLRVAPIITTIEGLAENGELHPLQAAFVEHDGFQCGYCTPGQICSAVGMFHEFQNGLPSAVTKDMSAATAFSVATAFAFHGERNRQFLQVSAGRIKKRVRTSIKMTSP